MSFRDVLRIRGFRDLWIGQAISQAGDAFYYVSFMYMVQQITGSLAVVGFVGALETLPFLLFSPYAGVLADRMDRRKIMLLSDVVSGGTLLLFGAFLLTGIKPPVWTFMTVAFLLSTVRCFFYPAKSAAIPNLVPAEKLTTANALSTMTQSFMQLGGLVLSASTLGILHKASPTWFYASCVLVNALSFLVAGIFAARLPKIQPERKEEATPKAMAEFREGMRYVGKRRELVVLIALLATFRLFVAPFFVVYLAANKEWFGNKPQTISWLEAGFFLGLLLMMPLIPKFKFRRIGWPVVSGLVSLGVLIGAMAYTPSFWPFLVLQVFCGFAVPFIDIPIQTYLQMSVDDVFRGRVQSVVSMIGMSAMPIGNAVAGNLTEALGLVMMFVIMGIGMVASAGLAILDPAFRRAELVTQAPPASEEPEAAEGILASA